MSSGGYDTPYSYSVYLPGDSWRASDLVYDRPHQPPPHRRSPSPPRRYMTYDRYVPSQSPPRSGPAWPDSYRPSSPSLISRYHADTPNPYRARSPSPWNASKLTPNPYHARSPGSECYFTSYVPASNPWDSSSSWQHPLETPVTQERQLSSPTTSASHDRDRKGSMLAKRMFEPSASWKQSHSDRREDTARAASGEGSPIVQGDSYRPGASYNDRSVAGRNGYDSYIPDYLSSSPDSRRKSPPRPRVRNIWPASRSRSRSASASPREPRGSSPYRRRPHSPSRSPSRGRRSSSRRRRRPSSRSRRSISRGVRSSNGGRRSFSRSRRSPIQRRRSHSHRCSHSRSSSRGGRRFRGRSPNRGRRSPLRSVSRTNSLRNGTSVMRRSSDPSRKKSRTRSPSRSSIASSIASSRASAPLPLQNANPTEVDVLGDSTRGTQVNPKLVQSLSCPPKVVPLPNGSLDSDAKKTGSSQVLPCSDQLQRISGPQPVMVTNTPVPPPSLPSPRSPLAVQHTKPSSGKKTPHLNGVVEREPVPEIVKVPNITSTPSNISSPTITLPLTTSLPVSLVPPSLPRAENAKFIFSSGIVSSNIVVTPIPSPGDVIPTSLPTPQLTPDPPKFVPQIRREITFPMPEDIPKLSEAKSTAEALRTVVMTRLLYDRQTREERVNPVLMANLQLAAHSRDLRPSSTAEGIIKEVAEGSRRNHRMERFDSLRGSLVENFRHRQAVMSEKVQRLRKEYVSLHERWVAHCASLDEQAKPSVTADPEMVQPVTRATRRSATMSDAVRSDLEMEQIIASLGYDEATDPNQLSLRNLATVPNMISVANGRVDYVFDDTNHLVNNPREYYGPTTGIHDWTDAEKEVFLAKFAAYPKQFGVIAEHIPNKTAAQCVDYYYLHKKKVIDFRKVISQYAPGKRRRKGAGRKKGNGLLADIRQHDAEVHGESEQPPPPSGRTGRRRMARPAPKEPKKPTVSRRATILQLEEASTATPTPEPETRPRRRRATGAASVATTTNATPATTPASTTTPPPVATPATTTNILPTPAASLSRTISTSVEDVEELPDDQRPAKRSRRTRKVKSAAVVTEEPLELTRTGPADHGDSNTRRRVTLVPAQWSEEDKSLFLRLLGQYGDDFKRIAASMPNKTTVQVSNYYKTNLVDLKLEKVAAAAPKRSPTPEARESSKDPGTVPDHTPSISSLTHDTSRASMKPPPREVPISATIRSNPSGISKQLEPAGATSPYAHLAYSITNGRLGHASSVIPPPPFPTIPFKNLTYPDPPSGLAQYATRPGQRPIAPHPDPTRRGTTIPSMHKGENPYPFLPTPGIPPPSTPYHYSLES